MSVPANQWTEMTAAEKRAAVKPMILAGKSYAEIASVLQIANRNSVAGVVTRLREFGELPPAKSMQAVGAEGGAIGRAKARQRKAQAAKPKAKPSTAGLDAINIAVRTEHRAEAKGLPINRACAFEPIPGHVPIPITDNFGCRWPVDGLHGPGLLACGAAKELEHVYCVHHRRLAYTPRHERAA